MKRNGIRLPDLSDLTNDRAEIVRIEGTKDGTVYVWDSRINFDEIRSNYPDASARIAIVGNDPQSILYSCGLTETKLYLGFNEDSFQPPLYFVLADSWEEAYETLENEHPGIRLDSDSAHDRADYKLDTDEPTCGFTSNGQPIDTELLQLWELKLTRIELA